MTQRANTEWGEGSGRRDPCSELYNGAPTGCLPVGQVTTTTTKQGVRAPGISSTCCPWEPTACWGVIVIAAAALVTSRRRDSEARKLPVLLGRQAADNRNTFPTFTVFYHPSSLDTD